MTMPETLRDPRPELPDTKLWKWLIIHAGNIEYTEAVDLHLVLWHFRSIGTTLVKEGGKYKLKPLISPTDWPDLEYYNEMREDYLKPHAARITELFRQLEGVKT